MTERLPHGDMPAANLLLLVSDEHHAGCVGYAGERRVPTPALDRLAMRSVRFTNAYTPSPICVPARASLATGLEVHQTRCWDNALAWTGKPEGWGHRLLAAGHRVESIGKLHYADAESPTGFGRQHAALHVAAGGGQVWGSVREPMPASAGRSHLFDQLGPGESDYNRFDAGVTQAACSWLRERAAEDGAGGHDGNKPWVLFVGWVAPHFPLVAPQRCFDRVHADRIALPPRTGERHPWVERMAGFMDHDGALGSDERRRQALHAYLALVAYLDEQVGAVLDTLDATGLAGQTRVLYTSDHGDNIGRRGLWNKCVVYGDSTRVPMLLAGPGITPRECATPVSLSDVHTSVLQGAGLASSARNESNCEPEREPEHEPDRGPGLLRIAGRPDDPSRCVLSQFHAVGSESAAYRIADAHWALHHYVGHRPELFNLAEDPDEQHDLAADPAHAATLARYEARLRERLDPEATDRAAKRDQAALVAAVGGRDAALAMGPRGATPIVVAESSAAPGS